MYKILHPVTGEHGYFASEQEKVLIDAILNELSCQFVPPHESVRGGDVE